jgi:hypothetical protein
MQIVDSKVFDSAKPIVGQAPKQNEEKTQEVSCCNKEKFDDIGVLGTSPPNVTLFATSHIARCL